MMLFAPALDLGLPNVSAYKGMIAVLGMLGIIIFAVVFAIAFIYYWIISFPVTAYIFHVRGGNIIQVTKDRMKKISRNRAEAYVFRDPKKRGQAIASPKTNYLFMNKRGKPVLFLREDSSGNYNPIDKLDLNENKFTVEEKDTRFWFVLNQRLSFEAYKDKKWIDKYGNYAIFMVCMIICFLMVILVIQKIDIVADALNSASSRFAGAMSNANVVS